MADTTQEIRVHIAHPDNEAFSEIDEALVNDRTVRIVGRSTEKSQTLSQLVAAKPDVLLLDGDASDLQAMETLEEIFVKDMPVGGIILWETQDNDRIRAAMRVGAEDFLIKPVTPETLITSVNNVFNAVREKSPMGWEKQVIAPAAPSTPSVVASIGKGKIVGICSGKAGVGKTTLGTNLAVALAKIQGVKTTLLDLDHSDAAVLLNLKPARSVVDLAQESEELDYEMMKSCLAHHASGLNLIPGTLTSGVSDLDVIRPALIEKVMGILRSNQDYLVVIFPLLHGDEQLQLLESCDEVYCVATAHDLLDLKNTKAFLDSSLNKIVSEDKVKVVLNRYAKDGFVSLEDVEKTLSRKVDVLLPVEERHVTDSINVGIPFVLQDSKNPMSEGIIHLSAIIAGREIAATPDKEKRGWWIFGKKR